MPTPIYKKLLQRRCQPRPTIGGKGEDFRPPVADGKTGFRLRRKGEWSRNEGGGGGGVRVGIVREEIERQGSGLPTA